MPILNDKKPTSEVISTEQAMLDEKKRAHDAFLEQERQINERHTLDTQKNQERLDILKGDADLKFKNAPRISWTEYQAAEKQHAQDKRRAVLKHTEAQQVIDEEHTQQLAHNRTVYAEAIRQIEKDAEAKPPTITAVHAKEAKETYRKVLDNIRLVHDESKRFVSQMFYEASQSIHRVAVKATSDLDTGLQLPSLLRQKESYDMAATKIGLAGIASDLLTYMGADEGYDFVQPLLNYTDLRIALENTNRTTEYSALKSFFYGAADQDVRHAAQDLNVFDGQAFLKAVHSSIASVHGFKEHIIQTIARYNQTLARDHGLESIKLSKKHLSHSMGWELCTFDETPWHRAKKENMRLSSQIGALYREEHAELKAAYEQAVGAVEHAYRPTCESVEGIYNQVIAGQSDLSITFDEALFQLIVSEYTEVTSEIRARYDAMNAQLKVACEAVIQVANSEYEALSLTQSQNSQQIIANKQAKTAETCNSSFDDDDDELELLQGELIEGPSSSPLQDAKKASVEPTSRLHFDANGGFLGYGLFGKGSDRNLDLSNQKIFSTLAKDYENSKGFSSHSVSAKTVVVKHNTDEDDEEICNIMSGANI